MNLNVSQSVLSATKKNASMKPVSSNKIMYLESLRGIAALTVVLFHLRVFASASFITANSFVENGELMVDFFFVLSGFVIAYNYSDRISNFASLINFQTKRFLRLYPLHLLTLLVFLGIEILKYFFNRMTGVEANNPAFVINDFGAFVSNLFLTQSMLEEQLTFNRPSWSISTEFYTYAVFGLVFLFTPQKFRVAASIILILVASVIVYVYQQDTVGLAIFRCIYAFFIGVICSHFFEKVQLTVHNSLAYLALVFAVVSVCFGEQLHHLIHPMIFAALILCLLWSGESYLKSILCTPVLIFLGTVSYGVYMIHTAVWWGVTQMLRFVFHFPTHIDQWGKTDLTADALTANIVVLLTVTIIVFLAYLSYRFVEMPFNRFGKKLKVD